MDNENIKVSEISKFASMNLMLELEYLNDSIDWDTPFEVNGMPVPCLRRAVNDAVINFTKNHLAPENIINLKGIYEALTGKTIEVIELEKDLIAQLLTFLNQLAQNVPESIEVEIDNEIYPCFKAAIAMIAEGWTYSPKGMQSYWNERIKDIYRIMHHSGHEQILNKY